MTASSRQSGNVIFIIIIMIGLFAGLSFAVNQSMKDDNLSGVNDQKAEILATEIIGFGNQVANGVKVLMANGCADNQLDFNGHNGKSYKTAGGGAFDYTNATAPSNDSCSVFKTAGAGITPITISKDSAIEESALPAFYMHPVSWFIQTARIVGIGTDSGAQGEDVMIVIGALKKDICIKINNMLGVTNPSGNPPADSYSGGKYTGAFTNRANAIGDTVTSLAGAKAFCAKDGSGTDFYTYHQLLIAR